MENISSLPLLFVVMLVLIARHAGLVASKDLQLRAGLKKFWILLVLHFMWGFATSYLALTGFYTSETFYGWYPGFWYPFNFWFISALFMFDSDVRKFIFAMLNRQYNRKLIRFQALRVLAVGTLIKTIMGLFPVYIEMTIGIADLLFGFYALYLGFFAKGIESEKWHGRVYWANLISFLVIAPGAVLIQLGLPSPIRQFATPPTAEVMFDFPMVLAPTLLVPLFVFISILTLVVQKRSLEERQVVGAGQKGEKSILL